VLAQQRLEQQRARAAAASRARANGEAPSGPDESMDPATFFQTLTPSLRTQLLSELEESQLQALPPDLVAEANALRREMEERQRSYVEHRMMSNSSAALSSLLRHPNLFHGGPGTAALSRYVNEIPS
jgi:E3 ubiquitin-protein ligase HUWE1